jgi:hypothetical protein
MTWKRSIKNEIIRNHYDVGYFTLQEFLESSLQSLELLYPENNTCRWSIQGNLRKLRDDNYLEFVDNKGTYRVLSEENDEWIKFVDRYHGRKFIDYHS